MSDLKPIREKGFRQTVLVVDDMPENLNVLGGILQPHYHVRIANSGERALEVAVTEPIPDLVLLDVMMPGMDGYQVLEHLREDERTSHIPVIFVTALNSMADEEKGLALGAVDYVAKPVKPALMLARVRSQLELKRYRDRLWDENRRLEERVALRLRENQIIQDVSILVLANLAETRDPETGNHLRRTQSYVEILARQVARMPGYGEVLTPRRIDLITRAAPLHDIGKVGIPDYILLKPGRLSPDEFKRMQDHCRLGAGSIEAAMKGACDRANWQRAEEGSRESEESPFEFLEVAREIVLNHHERWDGSGYPQGLSGYAIPLPGRLMAIADVFDALVSWRIYKRPVSFEDAVRTIMAGSGTQFDPELAEAFLQVSEQFHRVATRLNDDEASRIPGGQGGG